MREPGGPDPAPLGEVAPKAWPAPAKAAAGGLPAPIQKTKEQPPASRVADPAPNHFHIALSTPLIPSPSRDTPSIPDVTRDFIRSGAPFLRTATMHHRHRKRVHPRKAGGHQRTIFGHARTSCGHQIRPNFAPKGLPNPSNQPKNSQVATNSYLIPATCLTPCPTPTEIRHNQPVL